MTPTIGRIVHYRLTSNDAQVITRIRRTANPEGALEYSIGNPVSEGYIYPAMVVAAFGSDAVNLKVFLDGSDDYWACSRNEGAEPGCWFWPPR